MINKPKREITIDKPIYSCFSINIRSAKYKQILQEKYKLTKYTENITRPQLTLVREANFVCKKIAVKSYTYQKTYFAECVCIKGSAFISY